MRQGKSLWRSQLGNEWTDSLFDYEPTPLPPSRMKPFADRAVEGRVNSKGIPCLYLSTTRHAAMSEARPWIDAIVTVAEFTTVRPLTLVDCSVLHGQHSKLLLNRKFGQPLPPEAIDEIVWAAIDDAFAEPVTRVDDSADYAATQTIAELFRKEGYDGVVYKSAFGDDAYSVALFDLADANQINAATFKTDCAEFKFSEIGNPYSIKQSAAAAEAIVQVDPTLLGRIDAAAEKLGVSRSAWFDLMANRMREEGEAGPPSKLAL